MSAIRTLNSVTVSVKDDGLGISREIQLLIFNLFAQGDQTENGDPGALGIGLSLLHTIVEMHVGKVDIHSDGMRHRSELTVLIPALPVPGTEADHSSADDTAATNPDHR